MRKTLGCVIVAVLLAVGPSWAQSPQPTLESVGAIVKDGETVVITCERATADCDSRIRGKLSMVSGQGLELTVGERLLKVPGDRILRIERPKDSVWDGFGIGLAAGAGIGAAIGLVAALSDDDEPVDSGPFDFDFAPSGPTMFFGAVLLGAGVGAGVGAAVDS